MSDYLDEPELDFDLLRDWCDFCEGVRNYENHCHFSSLLMGVFVGDLTPEVERFLREFTKYFPQPLYDNLVRLCGVAEKDHEVLPWVQRDLDEKQKILAQCSGSQLPRASQALEVVDGRRFTFTYYGSALLDRARSSASHSALYIAVGEFVSKLCRGHERLVALHEALYPIATDYFVAHAIMAPLLETDINLGHYFEIYLRGGGYVLGEDQIVVHTHPTSEAKP